WHGEQVAKAFYPEATIIRPSICYGYGDFWFQRMAMQWSWPWKNPKLINGKQIIQPCHFLDVARAVTCAILDPLTTKGKTYSIYGPIRATKEQFFGRTQELEKLGSPIIRVLFVISFFSFLFFFLCLFLLYLTLLLARIFVIHRWLYKPVYPIQRRIQHFFDFFRWYNQIEFINYEDIQLNKINMYPNYESDPKLLTLEDLGIKPGLLICCFHISPLCFSLLTAKAQKEFLLSPDYFVKSMARTSSEWGGEVPSTDLKTIHSLSQYGYRSIRKGGYDVDWWAPDVAEHDFQSHNRENSKKVEYGSDIDGNDRLKQFVKEGKVGYV
ncbi:NADH dehydrogenase, partial [Reticulomyxa filosa]